MLRLEPVQKNQITISNKVWLAAGGVTALASVLIGVWFLNNRDIYLSNNMYMEPNAILAISSNVVVEDTLIANGQLYITNGNYTNNGLVNCGVCSSGANYLVGDNGSGQEINGTNSIQWYDGVLDNPQGLTVNNRLNIRNSFLFQSGLITTDKTDTTDYVHFESGAVYSNTSDARHVNGYVARTGTGSFDFPIGDGNKLFSLGINPSSSSETFKAAYFHQNPGTNTILDGGTFSPDVMDSLSLSSVHDQEYWDLDGNATTTITLQWDNSSNVSSWTSSLDSIVVAGWDGTRWAGLGQASVSGDLSSGTVTSTPVIPDGYYAFTLGKDAEPLAPLPVEWLSFSGIQRGADAHLTWTVLENPATRNFVIERSLDLIQYEILGKIEAKGRDFSIIEYSFLDKDILDIGASSLHYRIKQIDFDGQFSYSRMVEMSFEQEEGIQFSLFPNPTADLLHVKLTKGRVNDELVISDLTGRNIYEAVFSDMTEKVIPVSDWAEGAYILSVRNNNQVQSDKFYIYH